VQAGGTVQGASSIPRRGRRLEALLALAAILVIAAAMALVVWVFPLASSGGVETQDANPKAGAAAGSAIIHDDAGNMPSGTGSAIIHDDAGNVR
jgi:hypothetical protein